MLANFLDLVLWGHEHECLITPQSSSVGDFFIVQPGASLPAFAAVRLEAANMLALMMSAGTGSSVATSLSEGESKKKHIGLLEIYEDQFRLQAIELKTVRPFVMEEVVLKEAELDPGEPQLVMEFLAEKVEELIAKADKLSPHAPRTPTKPLIRLKVNNICHPLAPPRTQHVDAFSLVLPCRWHGHAQVEYSGYSTVNPQRFGQRFVGRVANPNEILLFHKKRGVNPRARVDKEQDVRRHL
jgi:double-strand break repair protein MRE11